MLVSIDGPGRTQKEAHDSVLQEFKPLVQAVQYQDQNFGINYHNYLAYNTVFSHFSSSFNVAIEDDAVLSPDALELADWFYALPERDEYALCSLGRVACAPEDPRRVDECCGLGTSWAYCFTQESWRWMRERWNSKKAEPLGWDWSLTYEMYRAKKKALIPALSRVYNIGREGGVNAYPEWWDENMRLAVVSSGLPASFFLNKIEQSSGLVQNSDIWTAPEWIMDEIRASIV